MLKTYRPSIWFLTGLALALWLGIFLLRKNGIIILLVNDYLTDLMTIPMYGYLIEFIMNKILKYNWTPDFAFILTSIIYISILFEFICPRISSIFTGDVWDVVAYAVGGFLYFGIKKIYHKIS